MPNYNIKENEKVFVKAPVYADEVTGFETSSELDSRDTANRSRANHTGTQTVSTISDFSNHVGLSDLSEDSTVTGTKNIDWNYGTHYLTMTGNTTFSDTNLPATGKTKVISIYMTGNYTPTFPANWTTNQVGTYDGTVLNLIALEYIKSGVYWLTIQQAD